MKPIQILLVEDNEGDILLTKEALTEGKIVNDVHVVRDGWEAMKFLKKEEGFEHAVTPDLILLDVNLPRLDGHEVLEKIKNDKELKMIPVVMLTTSSSASDILKSYGNHANCYITKPVEIDDFMSTVSGIEDFWISIVQLPSKSN
ncbi:MAG: response regulator [Flavobacteriales bacterium]|nr:response regulator [Flavobacteriales bacterium]